MGGYDLVVAGAGPAGLTLAWKACDRGLRVLVFDRKKDSSDIAYTTSGSFIDLDHWGLPADVAHPIDGIRFSSDGACLEGRGKACVIRRRRLLAELENRCVSLGADIRYSCSAKKVEVDGGKISGVGLSDGSDLKSTLYADCSGLGQVFNRALPVFTGKPTQALGFEYIVTLKAEPSIAELYMGRAVRGGYGWLFPLSDKEAIVGAGTLRRELFPKIRDMLDSMLALPRFRARIELTPIESHSGIFNTGHPLRCFHRGNLFLVGDVALQGNPAAGEGVRFVMDAADMAANAAYDAVKSEDLSMLAGYSKAWVKKYYSPFRMNYLLQKALVWLSEHDSVLDFTIRTGAKASDDTLITLIKGGADPGFLLRKLPKLVYKPFSSRKRD
ncbi:MAG: NAD(P)/FAD-dependent oxidoreductase [Candidatus Altiarchaeota archaeon]